MTEENVFTSKEVLKPFTVSGYRAPIRVDARPMGKGKTREASKRLTSQEDPSNPLFYMPRKCKEENLEKYPILTVNYYIAPNTSVKNRVFSEIKKRKDIIKGKDSRFFLDLRNSNKEKPIDKVYRKVHAGGPPVAAAVFGKNTLMYVLYAERYFNEIGVDRVSRLYMDDVIPGMSMVAIPITRLEGGREVARRIKEIDEYYLQKAPTFLLDIEQKGISCDALREDQIAYIKELGSAAIRFLLYWPDPIYLTKMGLNPYVWPQERLRKMLLFGDDLYIASDSEYYAFVFFLEWLTGAPNFFIATPNKPKASRSLSSVLEENSEALLKEAAKIELLLLALQGTEWARKVVKDLSEGKTVRLSDLQTNIVLAHVFSAAGIEVNVLNGTSLMEGGGFIHHDKKGILIRAVEDDKGRFEGWNIKQIISYNDQTLEVDPEGGREDVRVTLDGETGFPTIEMGAREYMERTGLNIYEIRMSLDDSTIAPIASIKNIYIPRPRTRFTNLVYRDLDRKLRGKDKPKDFTWFIKRARGAGSQTLVRNLHIISRTLRFYDDYEIVHPISHMEDMLEQVAGTGEEVGTYLGVYATVMMAELLRRYAKEPEITRIVVDPKILSLVSKAPSYWMGNREIEKDYQLISSYLPGTIAQANRGRSDRIVYGDRAHVLWLTAVDPLYERSPEFKWFVGLSEINQTLGRFVHRGEASAKELDLVFLGAGRSNFTYKAIVSLLDHIVYAEVEEDKIPVYATDGLNRRKALVRLCGHTLGDLYEAEVAKRRGEWRDKAAPEQLISDDEWAYVEARMREVEASGGRPVDIVLAAFEAMSEIDARKPLISDEWYQPGFDEMVAEKAKKVELKRALEPRSLEEIERERKRIKEMEARRERKYIESVKIYLEEEYNLSTSINNKDQLKELLYHIEEYGRVPDKFRRYVWDSDGREENPYL
jgi:hypothetical protein